MAWFSYTALVDGNVFSASDFNTPMSNAANGTVGPANGGTGLTSGAVGAFLYFSGTTTIAATASPTIGADDARTNTVVRNLTLQAMTSGTPAAGIGTGLLFNAESGDEAPSNFGALDFVASDVGAGTEDTYASVSLRVAGRAIDEKYQLRSTSGDGFAAIFTHANTADRTYTLPDSNLTLGATGMTFAGATTTEGTTTSASLATLSTVTVSLAQTVPFLVVGSWRKTGGAAASVSLSLMLNATSTGGGQVVSTATDRIESGQFQFYVGPRTTNYRRPSGFATNFFNVASDAPQVIAADGTEAPTATITSVIIQGVSGSGSVTLGVADVSVYALATS